MEPMPPSTTMTRISMDFIKPKVEGFSTPMIAGVQAAGHAGKGGGEGKGHDLVVGGLDAAALGGDLIVADGQHGTAVAALHHGVDEEAGDDHAQEHVAVKLEYLGMFFRPLAP